MCVFPGFGYGFAFNESFRNWRASCCLDGDHLWPLLAGIKPSELFEFIESFPHSNQTDATTGWIEDCIGRTPSKLLGDFQAHGLLAFDAEWFFERGNIKPTLRLLAFADDASAVADQPIDQIYVAAVC